MVADPSSKARVLDADIFASLAPAAVLVAFVCRLPSCRGQWSGPGARSRRDGGRHKWERYGGRIGPVREDRRPVYVPKLEQIRAWSGFGMGLCPAPPRFSDCSVLVEMMP